ncbi:hypothetical protein F4859DRAFT_523041 [Xylaria cf. heliscus]|nr:hypothetical protein F4859DRAFT_523041 [Xylaria cf. heliscus]
MVGHNTLAVPYGSKGMRRQAPTMKSLNRQVLFNKDGKVVDLKKLLLMMNEARISKDISTVLQWNRVEIPKDEAYLWQDLRCKTDNIKRASSSGSVREKPQGQAPEARISSLQPESSSEKTVVETATQDDESDAISDTSFTPPKQLQKRIRYDEHGHREVLPPPVFGHAVPKPQSRFIYGDRQGRKHLMPPPGFRGALPKLLSEIPSEPKVKLTFERKKDFKKEFKARQGIQGGISLARMREQSSYANEKNKKTENKTKKKEKKMKKKCSFEVSQTIPQKEQPASPKQPEVPRPAGRLIGGWESAFLKGIFDAEEDLLYSSRWPASTF